MQIKKLLKGLYYSIKSPNINFNETKLCGVPLKLLPGTVRKQEDQDDAWWFF